MFRKGLWQEPVKKYFEFVGDKTKKLIYKDRSFAKYFFVRIVIFFEQEVSVIKNFSVILNKISIIKISILSIIL